MDVASVIGLVLVLVGVFFGSMLKGVQPMTFFSVPAAFLIVVVASIGAGMLGSHIRDVKSLGKLMLKSIKPGATKEPAEAIELIVGFADQARREGLLSLEDKVNEIDDPFMRRGLQLAIDGVDSDSVRDTMEAEIDSMRERHKAGAKLMTSIGVYSPTFGIIGAVVGLIATLSHLDDPSKLGHGIAAAFVATFWGVFMANGVFLPMANKLTRLSQEEIRYKELIVEGVLSIQAGANPRTVNDLLRSYLPPQTAAGTDLAERKSA
ncbi:MAG TPA: flagellar motor protein [Acidimicrobiales bacterium]